MQYKPSSIRMARASATGMSTLGIVILLVVVVLVGIGIVYKLRVGAIMNNFENGKYRAGVAQVRSLDLKVQAYVLDVGSAPASLDDLLTAPPAAKKWDGPYARASDLKDPFGGGFVYKSPGEHGAFDIVFLGKDAKPGGNGINEDVGNWQAK